MSNYISASQGKCPCRLRKKPVKADHYSDIANGCLPDLKTGVSGCKPEFFLIEQMCFSVNSHKTIRPCQYCRVIEFSFAFFRYACNNIYLLFSCNTFERPRCIS